jgi:methylmalonyl-CoA mutase N-terminal domain/subunit
LPCL